MTSSAILPVPDSEEESVVDLTVHTSQPGYAVQMDPFKPKGIVPGSSIEKLMDASKLRMRQNKTSYNATAGTDYPNKFTFLDENDQQLFLGQEESDLICRCALGRTREYTMCVQSESGDTVLRVSKEFSALSTFGCCSFASDYTLGHTAQISDENRARHGFIGQKFDMVLPWFVLKDADDMPRFEIVAHTLGCCLPSFCGFMSGRLFIVYKMDKNDGYEQVGEIGIEEESGNSYVSFSKDFQLSERVLLMAALIHLNILFLTNSCGCQQD